MCRTHLKNEVGLVSHSLVKQRVIKFNNISDTISGAKDIKLNKITLPFRNSEMAIQETFSWRGQ